MAWTSSGPSVALAVTDQGATMPLPYNAGMCRVWVEGPGACRIRYGVGSAPVDDTDLILPSGLLEVHNKAGRDTLGAKTRPGETTTIHVICGSGD